MKFYILHFAPHTEYAFTYILPRVVTDGLKYVVFGKNVVINELSSLVWMMLGCEMTYSKKEKKKRARMCKK
jgi:hypothetical protein